MTIATTWWTQRKCNLCMDCISPCPTGSIDNWRMMPRVKAHSVEAQLGWDELPPELSAEELAVDGVDAAALEALSDAVSTVANADSSAGVNSAQYGATLPPWSAAHPFTNLYGPKAARRPSPPRSPATCG